MTRKRFFSSDEIESLQQGEVMGPIAHALRAPMAQLLLVTQDVPPGDSVCVRSTSLCPLIWSPYSQSINIPLDDERVVRNLSAPGAECVRAEPTRAQLRELAELRDEGYISDAECELLLGWRKRWDDLFREAASPERAALKARLTEVSRFIVQRRWAKLHQYLREACPG